MEKSENTRIRPIFLAVYINAMINVGRGEFLATVVYPHTVWQSYTHKHRIE